MTDLWFTKPEPELFRLSKVHTYVISEFNGISYFDLFSMHHL